MTEAKLFEKYQINESHNTWGGLDDWLSVDIFRLMHNNRLPTPDDVSMLFVLDFLDKTNEETDDSLIIFGIPYFGSMFITAKRLVYKHAHQLIKELEERETKQEKPNPGKPDKEPGKPDNPEIPTRLFPVLYADAWEIETTDDYLGKNVLTNEDVGAEEAARFAALFSVSPLVLDAMKALMGVVSIYGNPEQKDTAEAMEKAQAVLKLLHETHQQALKEVQ